MFQASLFLAAALTASRCVIAHPSGIEARQGNIPFLKYCEQGCDDCPGMIRAVERSTDNSECTSFNSQDTFPSSYQTDTGGWNVFFDTNDVLSAGWVTEVIVRSPAGTDVDGCGVPIRVIDTDSCTLNTLTSTFLLQYCQGDGCDGLTPSDEELELADRLRAESPTGQPNVTAYNEGVKELRRKKRDLLLPRDDGSCTGLTQTKDTYTKLADYSTKASTTQTCSSTEQCNVAVGSSESVSYTLSVSTSAGIEGLFSTELSFSLETSTESSITQEFAQGPGSTGYVAWTPIYECKDGNLSGCSGDVSDGPVTGCRGKKVQVNGQTFWDGVYSFVNTE